MIAIVVILPGASDKKLVTRLVTGQHLHAIKKFHQDAFASKIPDG